MAWRRNRKTGGWFEVPDEPTDTNGYMNQKIRQEAKPIKTNQTLTERIDALENEIESAKTRKQVLDILDKNNIPYKDQTEFDRFNSASKTKELDVIMDDGFRRIYYLKNRGYIFQKRKKIEEVLNGKKRKIPINETTYAIVNDYDLKTTKR